VRHRDQHPVHVQRDGEAGHNDIEVFLPHLQRDAQAVVAAIGEGAGEGEPETGRISRGHR
jgi:hypothetical protein